MTPRPTIIMALLLTAASSAAANISLRPADAQDPNVLPYRSAVLRFTNDTNDSVLRIAFRSKQGGPTMLFPAIIPEGATAEIPVALPAVRAEQEYDICVYTGIKKNMLKKQTSAAIAWPTDWVNPEAFFDSLAYEPYAYDLPAWPRKLRREIFLSVVLAFLAVSAALLIRRRIWRLGIMAIVMAVTSGWLIYRLDRQETLRFVRGEDNTLVITACRTTRCRDDRLKNTYPVYMAPWQFAEDNAEIRPGRFIDVIIHPEDVRMFREAKTSVQDSSASD